MTRRKKAHLIKRLNRLFIYALILLAVLLSVAPILYLFITSLKDPELAFAIPPVWNFTPTLRNYNEVISSTRFDRYFFNSIVVALSTTAIALVLGSLAAYGFSRFRFRGHFWLRMSTV